MFSCVNISLHGKASYRIKNIYSTASYFTAPRLKKGRINFTNVRGNIYVFSRGYFKSFSKYKFPSGRPIMFTRLTETVSQYKYTASDRWKIYIPTASYLNISNIDVRALQNIPEHLKSLHTYFIKSPGESDKNEFHENEERKKSSKSSDDSSATPSTENITCKKSSKLFEDSSSAPYTEYFAGKTSSESIGDSSSTPNTEDVIGKTFSKSFVMFDDSSSTPYTEAFTGKTCSKLFDDLSAVLYTDDCIGKTSSKSFDDSSAMNVTEALAERIAFSAVLEGSSSLIATLSEEGKKKSDIRMILRKIRQQTSKGLSIGMKDGMIYGISAETMRAIFNKMLEDESYANLIANTTGSLTLVIVKYMAICNEFEKGNVSKTEMNRRIIKLLTFAGLKLSIISTVNPSIVPMIAICLILKVGDRLYGDEVMNSVFKQFDQYMNNCDRKIVDGFVADLPKRCK